MMGEKLIACDIASKTVNNRQKEYIIGTYVKYYNKI